MLRKFKRFADAEDGAVMVIAAISLIVFLSVVSLVTDMGLKYYQKNRLQSALDSAALAAVRYMPDEEKARITALEYVEKNGFSTENVVVEFPDEETVRVSDTRDMQTIFATLFKVESVQIHAKAAAKYVYKNVGVNLDYLMFHGDNIPFNLYGHYNIGGSVFGNGNVYADGGAGSKITGTVFSSQTAAVNTSSVAAGHIQSNVVAQKMPDYDEMIMSVAPTASETVFERTYNHIGKNSFYLNRYDSDATINSFIAINGSTYCAGNLSTGWSSELLTVYGDLYVTGNFNPQCPVYVTGNVYCGGNLVTGWDKTLKVGGNLYVEGSADFQGTTSIYGNYFYVGGNLNRGSNYSLNCDCETFIGGDASLNGTSVFGGTVYCKGSFTKHGSVLINAKKGLYVSKALYLESGGNYFDGDIAVFGNGLTANDNVTTICGPMTLAGDIYSSKGDLSLSGQGSYNIRGHIYSGGRIITNQGPDGITLNGCMIAENDVKIGGSAHTYNETGGSFSVYSRNGNITLMSQQGGFEVWGMIYAPKGNVALSSGDFNIHGSIIGNTITCTPGGLNMSYNDRPLPFTESVETAVLIE